MARSTASRPTGTISAPPTPWHTRVAVSTARSGASAQPAEARVNTTIAAVRTGRTPNRSAAHPLSGMSTATVTR